MRCFYVISLEEYILGRKVLQELFVQKLVFVERGKNVKIAKLTSTRKNFVLW